MKIRCLVFLFFIFISQAGFAQKENELVVPVKDSIFSTVLKEQREFWVYLPNSRQARNDSTRYPVLYLLDAEVHFTLVAGMVHVLSKWDKICPQMIIIGIPNVDRTRDLTPTHSLLSMSGKERKHLESSGGGEQFTRFIKNELIPAVNAKYPVNSKRILAGHSMAGLLVLNILIHQPETFENYISIDPSIWWDNRKLMKEAEALLKQNKFPDKKLFLGIANNLPPGMDTISVASDTTSATLPMRSILNFGQSLKAVKKYNTKFYSKYYNDETHFSIPFVSYRDALRFLLVKE
jgi:uncharacterized protein